MTKPFATTAATTVLVSPALAEETIDEFRISIMGRRL